MADNTEPDTTAADEYLGDSGAADLIEEERLLPTPQQHEQLKNSLHDSDRFDEIKQAKRRYLIAGSGSDDPGERRERVCSQLDRRRGASAFRLEDFEFTGDDIDLWAPAFDILSSMASHIVGVIEDFDGGYVWELGFLYHLQRHTRDILWLLKRIYDTDDEMREQYDNGMAASHMAALEKAASDRVITWKDDAELSEAVEQIP